MFRHPRPFLVDEPSHPPSQLMDYNENFRLFMVTRNPKPELPPDASALVCEVNFTVTRFALNIEGGS